MRRRVRPRSLVDASGVRVRLTVMPARETLLEEARETYGRNEWTEARAALLELDAEGPLEAADLERLAWACRWVGDEGGFLGALERAEAGFVAAGAKTSAGRTALDQARQNAQMLNDSVALSCYLRATDHLDGQPESPEHSQALWSLAFAQMA